VPRVKNQDVPPDLQEAYDQTLGPTRAVTYPGGRLPDSTDQTSARYPGTPEPPHVPTVKQIRQREYFQDVFECFNLAPDNERTAYWRLSRAGALRYYNDYMHKNIPRRIAGETCPDWAAPYARSFISEQTALTGYCLLPILDTDLHVLTIELELDPITVGAYPPPWPIPNAPYSLIHYWFDWSDVSYRRTILATFDPTERAEYYEEFEIPEISDGDPIENQIRFYRYGASDEGEAVMWSADLDDAPAVVVLSNFE